MYNKRRLLQQKKKYKSQRFQSRFCRNNQGQGYKIYKARFRDAFSQNLGQGQYKPAIPLFSSLQIIPQE